MFSVRVLRRVRVRVRVRRNDFCFSRLKPFELDLRYLEQRKYMSGEMYWMSFLWPWPEVTTVALINKNVLVCKIKWEPLNQSLQNLAVISLWSCLIPDEILEKFCWNFFYQIFSRSNTLFDIFQEWLVRSMWNEKVVHQLDTGWTRWPWPLTLAMTLTQHWFR